jgi:hypothetical protein
MSRTERTASIPGFRASDVAHATTDAYAFPYFGIKQWSACTLLLASRGYNEAETRAILYSRVMRTAADDRQHPDRKATSADLLRLLELPSTAEYLRDNLDEYVLNIIGEDLITETPATLPSRAALRLVWSR